MKTYILKTIFVILFCLSGFSKAKAQNTAGDSIFGSSQIHDVYLNFSQVGWWDSLTANYTADIYMKCNMIFDGVSYNGVGVKFKGNSSYNNPFKKKSLKIGVDEYDTLLKVNKLKKFNLNNGFKDPSFLREKLALDFANQMGAIAPRCTYARVYLNNVYWGLYNLVEEITSTFLKDHFADKRGNLFKGDPSGDLKWLGSTASLYYSKYELKTNTTANNWSDLVRLIDKINNSTTTALHDSLDAIMNTTSTIKAWTITNLFSNLDSYLGSGHNYYVYHDSLTNKFNYILWDVNESFGNFNMGMSIAKIEAMCIFFISNPATNCPLYNKMLANTTYKAAYITEICNMANYFSNAMLDAKIDSLKNLIAPSVLADTLKFYTYNDFLNNVNNDITIVGNPGGNNIAGIKSFITARHNALVTELASQNCFVGINVVTNNFSFAVFPNPVNGNSVTVSSAEELKTIELFNALGEKLSSFKCNNKNETTFNLNGLEAGIYFLRVNNTATKKLIITSK